MLKKKIPSIIGDSIAPGNSRLGVMLPYTPLHYIIFEFYKQILPEEGIPALVMTSANLSEEPIAIKNAEAKERLKKIADAFILHDREILIRADDSVAFCVNGKERMLRRSRGFVPKPFIINELLPKILSVGAELKNTICITTENKAFLSQHIGDLTNYAAYKFFQATVAHLQKIMDVSPGYAAHDLHPNYLSTKWTKAQTQLKSFAIQHHHAHMGAAMAEYGLNEDVIGVILDGTGYGYDGTIWGGEILTGNYTEFKRCSYLEPYPLPGGDAAVKEPWRIAYSYLYSAFNGTPPKLKLFEDFPVDIIKEMLKKNINTPFTSSMGRLFDAVSVLTGGPVQIRYEAEAAIQLMHLVNSLEYDPYEIDYTINSYIPLKGLLRQIYSDVGNNIPKEKIAAKFHITITDLLIEAVNKARKETGINKVVISGGVFQNELLLTLMENKLKQLKYEVYSHSKLPPNDGSISLGQAVIASELIRNKMDNVNYIT